MLDREQLETFATIVEQGSFERAASVLSVTRGAVSQRIKALEESLATVLLVREKPTRSTKSGEALMRYVKALRLLEASTLHEVQPQSRPQLPVSLAVAVNADSLAGWFAPVVSQLMASGAIALEIVGDDQDHTFARLARGEVIGCVSTEAQPIQGFVAEPLGCMEYRCVARPSFAREHFPGGLSLQAVLSSPAVLYDRKDGLHDQFLHEIFGFTVERYVRHYIPQPTALLEAIVEGGGYGLVPVDQAQRHLDNGALLDLAPEHPSHVALCWHHWRSESPLAQKVTGLVIEMARTSLLDSPAVTDAPARRRA